MRAARDVVKQEVGKQTQINHTSVLYAIRHRDAETADKLDSIQQRIWNAYADSPKDALEALRHELFVMVGELRDEKKGGQKK